MKNYARCKKFDWLKYERFSFRISQEYSSFFTRKTVMHSLPQNHEIGFNREESILKGKTKINRGTLNTLKISTY